MQKIEQTKSESVVAASENNTDRDYQNFPSRISELLSSVREQTNALNEKRKVYENNNLLVEMAKHPIVSYLQSDMVISENYDEDVLRHVKPNMILSSTRVEPPLHGTSHEVITKDFGLDPDGFNLMEFNEFAQGHKSHNTGTEFFFAPFTFYKDTWLKAGGYDTIFRRSREDSDLLMRFRHQGVDIRQTYGAIVYHFTCVTSRGKDWYLSLIHI